MNGRSSTTYAFLALGLACSLTAAIAQDKPDLSGTWKTNIAKSNFGAFPAPQSSTTKIDHHDPDLNITTTSAGDQGERTMAFKFKTDGSECVNQIGNVEIKSKAKWDGGVLLIESKADMGGNEVIVKDKWTLSEDGKMITLLRTFSSSQGESSQTIISEKQ